MRATAAPPLGLANRLQFADLCMARGITRAVEVGTDRGFFAEAFLDRWTTGEVLVCVDPWQPYPHMPYDRLPDLLIAATLLARFRARVKLLRMMSEDAARILPTSLYHSPGFVYIDGDHAFEWVRADLAAWWPVLVPGGIFAGHDYTQEAVGVRTAVDAFVAEHRLDLHTTQDPEEAISWWVEKPR